MRSCLVADIDPIQASLVACSSNFEKLRLSSSHQALKLDMSGLSAGTGKHCILFTWD